MGYGVGGAMAEGIRSGMELGQSQQRIDEGRRQFDAELAIRQQNADRLQKQEEDRYGRLQDLSRMQAIQGRLDALEKLVTNTTAAGHAPSPELQRERAQLSVQLEDMQRAIAASPTGRLSAPGGVSSTMERPNVASAEPPATPMPVGAVGTAEATAPAPAPASPIPARGVAAPPPSPHAQTVAAGDQAAQDLGSRLHTGQVSLADVKPGDFALMVASATKRDPRQIKDLQSGIDDFHAGMETGNNGLTMQGLNSIFAPVLSQGVGKPSAYGGNITGAQIIGLDPAMSADGAVHTDKVIPRLRVTTDVKGTGGAPLYYDAPMMGPDGKVAAVSMADAMNHIGALGAMAQVANHPDAQAMIEKGASDPRVQAYLDAYNAQAEGSNPGQVKENMVRAYMRSAGIKDRDEAMKKLVDFGVFPRPPQTKGSLAQAYETAQQMVDSGQATDLDDAMRKLQRYGLTRQPTKYSPGAVNVGGTGGPAVGSGHLAGSDVLPAPDKSGLILGLTPRAIDDFAWDKIDGKTLPSFGRGDMNAKVKSVISNRAGELLERAGITPEEYAAGASQFKADARSLAMQQSKVDSINAVINSLHNNMKTFDDIASGKVPTIGGERVQAMAKDLDKIDFSQSRDWNDIKIKIGEHFNDPTMTAYAIAAMAVAMDVARIQVGGAQSVAQTAEGARREAIELINKGVNEPARRAMLGAIESDSMGQVKGLTDQLNVTRSRMGKGGFRGVREEQGIAPPAAPGAPGAPGKTDLGNGWSVTVH